MATVMTAISLTLSGRAAGQISATVMYDDTDPFAVTVAFNGETSNVLWVFARTLLIDGLKMSAGSGDVQICSKTQQPRSFA